MHGRSFCSGQLVRFQFYVVSFDITWRCQSGTFNKPKLCFSSTDFGSGLVQFRIGNFRLTVQLCYFTGCREMQTFSDG